MNINFKSSRLDVTALDNAKTISASDLVKLLTDKVTQYLPPNWQDITDDEEALNWLNKRLDECSVFTIQTTNQTKSLIGFLFLYGLEKESTEIRIGYILSEKHWGHGYASELVDGLVNSLKRVGHITSIIAGVTKGHISSIKVLTKNGFIFTESINDTEFYEYQFYKCSAK